MRTETAVISRHRLPQPYRTALTLLWVTPHLLMTAMLVVHLRDQPAQLAGLLDPRYWLPLALTLVPALYIWHEGIDVLEDGLRARVHFPHRYRYPVLSAWRHDLETGIVTIWDQQQRTIFETHAAHLTDVEGLVAALEQHVRRAR